MNNRTETETKAKTDYILVITDLVNFLDTKGIKNGKEIMLYAKILSMSEEKGFCRPSNKYLARILCVSERNITRYLTDLEARELITMNYYKEGADTKERRIVPTEEGRQFCLGGRQFRPTELSRGIDNLVGGRQDCPTELSIGVDNSDRQNCLGRQDCPTDLSIGVDNSVGGRQDCLTSIYKPFGASQESIEEAIEYLLTNNNKVNIQDLNNIVKKGIEVSSSFKEKKLYYIAKQLLKNPNTPVYVLDTFSTAYAEGRSVWRDD